MNNNKLEKDIQLVEQKKYIELLEYSVQDLRNTLCLMISACKNSTFTPIQRQDFIGHMQFILDGTIDPAQDDDMDFKQAV